MLSDEYQRAKQIEMQRIQREKEIIQKEAEKSGIKVQLQVSPLKEKLDLTNKRERDEYIRQTKLEADLLIHKQKKAKFAEDLEGRLGSLEEDANETGNQKREKLNGKELKSEISGEEKDPEEEEERLELLKKKQEIEAQLKKLREQEEKLEMSVGMRSSGKLDYSNMDLSHVSDENFDFDREIARSNLKKNGKATQADGNKTKPADNQAIDDKQKLKEQNPKKVDDKAQDQIGPLTAQVEFSDIQADTTKPGDKPSKPQLTPTTHNTTGSNTENKDKPGAKAAEISPEPPKSKFKDATTTMDDKDVATKKKEPEKVEAKPVIAKKDDKPAENKNIKKDDDDIFADAFKSKDGKDSKKADKKDDPFDFFAEDDKSKKTGTDKKSVDAPKKPEVKAVDNKKPAGSKKDDPFDFFDDDQTSKKTPAQPGKTDPSKPVQVNKAEPGKNPQAKPNDATKNKDDDIDFDELLKDSKPVKPAPAETNKPTVQPVANKPKIVDNKANISKEPEDDFN